jgi:transposase-like protein
MIQLNFEENRSFRWQESKRQFRARFWEETQMQIRGEVKKIMEDMLEMEFSMILGAKRYERTASRKTKRNGFSLRCLETPVGRIEDLLIPRSRQNLDIRFSLFDRWQQVSENVVETMLKTYLLGRSSSCAQQIIQAFGHSRFSRSYLQRLTHSFEDRLQEWLQRPILKRWPYLFIDGMVVDVKEVSLQQWCVLWALGMDENHHTEVLGFLVLRSESQEGCERLLRDLASRGLEAPKLIISDDSKAIEKAAAMVFPYTPQQGCIFHKVKACGRYLLNIKNRRLFLRDATDVYLKARGRVSLLQRLNYFKKKWYSKESRAVRCFLDGFERTMTFLRFPREHWRWIYTNNSMESLIDKIRDWTSRFGCFQGTANLRIALFTYLCHRNHELVPNESQITDFQKDTLLVA